MDEESTSASSEQLVSGREQILGDVKNGMQGIDNELEGVEEEVRELIEAQLLSAEPLITLDSRGTALHRAAERGLESVVARLLAVCPSLIDMVEDWGKLGGGTTALHYAALKGHAAIVAQLLAARPTLVDALTNFGWRPLHCAVEHGHPAIVTQLLALNPSLIEVKLQNTSILHRATKHPAIVAQLLAIKPSLIDEVGQEGRTVLHQAADDGQPAAVAELLAIKPTLIDAVTNQGWTALHMAAAADKCEPTVVAHLLAAANPALVDARDFLGRTALYWAVISGHCEIVAQLLSASPTSIEANANDGRSVLQLAVTASRNARRKHEITAQVFAAHPASLEAMINDPDSWTALQYVVGVGDEGAVARVLAMHPHLIHGAAPVFGWTVFHFAAFYDRPNVISQVVSHVLAAGVSQSELERLLLRRSTEMYEGVAAHSTALHVAVSKGHTNTITQLLAACPTLLDANQTCLHAAVNHESTMNYLIDLKPVLIHAVDKRGNTILHSILRQRGQQNFEFIERVWKMNPKALHVVNHHGRTPLFYAFLPAAQAARRRPGETAQIFRIVDLLQWSFTFDEIVSTYNQEGSQQNFYVARLTPFVKKQCGELTEKLIPDVVAIVFEYLGLKRTFLSHDSNEHLFE